MIKEIQFQRRKQTIYAMNENYEVVGRWPCRDEFVHGYNADGDPRDSLPNGLYTHVSAEITNGCYGPAYGNFTSQAEIRAAGISTVAVLACQIRMPITRAGFRHMVVSGCRTGTEWSCPR